ncbi:MAG: hypothetical protein JSU68_05245, partial [Phycisphaerales bacterium]
MSKGKGKNRGRAMRLSMVIVALGCFASPARADVEDCNGNEIPDVCDINNTTCQQAAFCEQFPGRCQSPDVNGNGIPDECEACVSVDKTGPEISKVGDDVEYTVEICNCTPADIPLPDLEIRSIDDTLQGDLTDSNNYDTSDCPGVGGTLVQGACCTIVYTRTVGAGDPDPLVNTATVVAFYNPAEVEFDASDDHSVDLFQPSIVVDKTGTPDLTKVGHDVTYTVVITNQSSADSPDLVIDAISDTLQGDLTDSNNYDSSDCHATLATGESCTIVYTRTVQGGDPDPLVNT